MSLRGPLLGIGVGLIVAGLVLQRRHGDPGALWLCAYGLLLIAGVVWERWRYRPLDRRPPGPGWQRTGERFVDPETGRLTEVWYHPQTGERRYVTP